MDGTLTVDGLLDFNLMRERANVPIGCDLLGHIASLPLEERCIAEAAVKEIERAAYPKFELNEGCLTTLKCLKKFGLKIGLLTRNTDEAVAFFLDKFELRDFFDITLSRDWEGLPKPHPDALQHISSCLQIDTKNLIMVGDWVDDVVAGNAAGCHSVFLKFEKNKEHLHMADHSIESLCDLIQLIETVFEIEGVLHPTILDTKVE
jgi:HAD superfamily hydrolase (TIGR01549 family)